MPHNHVNAAEEILDKEFKVLNKGFVRLVDYLGSDERIVQAARVSYGTGTKTVREDKNLIDYLLRNSHTSPFEQVIFTFHAKMPIFVARQWIRHRTARLNEISGRYSVMVDDFYEPELEDICEQSTENKQTRAKLPMDKGKAEKVKKLLKEFNAEAYSKYEQLLELDTARELARIILPLNLYTEWYWQIDLHNLLHFLKLRMHSHAQKEIQAYANTIYKIVEKICPLATESFNRHVLGGQNFSAEEVIAIKKMYNGEEHGLGGRVARIFEEKLK